MFNMRHFFRMARWARNPPGARQVKLFVVVVVLCLVLVGIERFVGWPDWLTMENTPRGRIMR
ncbi:MAG: hypothetical protein VX874_01285 [Pseudomonadota bacterium]|nr:hypothetical protein [Pseudomonadota bacterium]